jgi:multidrug efflux system outer membrane protein
MLGMLIVAGCAMGPDYERPETAMPEAYGQAVDSGTSIVNLNWWELFGDEQLNALVRIALEQNRDMAIAVSRIEEARAALGFVRSDQYPQFDVSAGANRGNSIPGTSVIVPINNNFVLAGNLSFELDLWGKLRRSTEAARAELLATVEAGNSVMITLIADVASAYLLLLDLDARVAIARRTLLTRNESLAIIQARFDRGIVPLIDVNQAEIEKYDAEAQLVALQREDVQVENLLNILLGQHGPGQSLGRFPVAEASLSTGSQSHLPSPSSGAIVRDRRDIYSLEPLTVPAGLPSELLERRPDIRVAEQQLAAQTARIGVAEAIRFPSLSLTGSLGLASDELSGFFSSDNKTWGLSAGLIAPVFNAGRNKRRVEVEVARTEQALLNYEQTVLQALREVEDSLVSVNTFEHEVIIRESQRKAATSAAMLSRARYDGGVTSYLEVLESERSLFRAELLASSTHREQLVSYVTLYKALGGGWVPDDGAD